MKQIKLTDINVGDIVLNNGFENVLFKMKSKEDSSSLCYDREYYLIPLSKLEDIEYDSVGTQELMALSYTVCQRGYDNPIVDLCDDIAPFKFEEISMTKISRKQLKTVSYYE